MAQSRDKEPRRNARKPITARHADAAREAERRNALVVPYDAQRRLRSTIQTTRAAALAARDTLVASLETVSRSVEEADQTERKAGQAGLFDCIEVEDESGKLTCIRRRFLLPNAPGVDLGALLADIRGAFVRLDEGLDRLDELAAGREAQLRLLGASSEPEHVLVAEQLLLTGATQYEIADPGATATGADVAQSSERAIVKRAKQKARKRIEEQLVSWNSMRSALSEKKADTFAQHLIRMCDDEIAALRRDLATLDARSRRHRSQT